MSDIFVYIIIVATAVISYFIYKIIKKKRVRAKLLKDIEDLWGKPPVRHYKDGEIKSIASYFNNMKTNSESKYVIDDITWNDLDMESVFKRINSAASTIGEEYLYSFLRLPQEKPEALNEINSLVNLISSDDNLRRTLQYELTCLGIRSFTHVSDYFTSNSLHSKKASNKYKLLSAALLLSPLILILNPVVGLISIISFFIINITVYNKAKSVLSSQLEALGYMVNLLGYARRISNIKIDKTFSPSFINCITNLKITTKSIKALSVNSFYTFFYKTEDPFMEYIKVVLLGELIAFESLLIKINKHKAEFQRIFEIVGYLDTVITIASYRKSLNYWCVPELTKMNFSNENTNINTKQPSIKFKDAYHPLIKNPVFNSLSTTSSILLTGSNASGKSTFLKMTAINAIFAQTICTCLAKEYSSSIFMIFSSMALKDSIENNESYYIAEIKSLKRIFNSLTPEMPCLCFIDEVLRGTNTVERIAASSQVLHELSKLNCLCIAATHDIELTSILKNDFENYHFQETLSDNTISFDYTLYNGKSKTRNAIKLLKFIGYDEKLVSSAENRAKSFEETGTWAI